MYFYTALCKSVKARGIHIITDRKWILKHKIRSIEPNDPYKL